MGVTSDFEGCITHGPWGSSSDGKEWVYKPKGYITKIIVHFDKVIDAIEFHSSSSQRSSLFGSTGDNDIWTHPICIDYPDEYLVSVSGTYGSFTRRRLVRSICFKTNQNRYGPFGTDDGTRFSYDVKGGKIVGFHGRAGSYLNAIGVYVRPKSLVSGLNSVYASKIKNEPCSILTRMSRPRDVGPWGAGGGKPWDDGVFCNIKQIRVHLGKDDDVIYAIQFEYLKSDGETVLSQIHGGIDASIIKLVNLNGKDEYLTGFSGTYGPVKDYDGLEAILSISFHTNKQTHGPYGEEMGGGHPYFISAPYSGKIVGFHGRSNGFLSAIGVHMEYF